jgi:hypothetical protein
MAKLKRSKYGGFKTDDGKYDDNKLVIINKECKVIKYYN